MVEEFLKQLKSVKGLQVTADQFLPDGRRRIAFAKEVKGIVEGYDARKLLSSLQHELQKRVGEEIQSTHTTTPIMREVLPKNPVARFFAGIGKRVGFYTPKQEHTGKTLISGEIILPARTKK